MRRERHNSHKFINLILSFESFFFSYFLPLYIFNKPSSSSAEEDDSGAMFYLEMKFPSSFLITNGSSFNFCDFYSALVGHCFVFHLCLPESELLNDQKYFHGRVTINGRPLGIIIRLLCLFGRPAVCHHHHFGPRRPHR